MQKKNQFKADSRYFTISIYTILTVLVICIIARAVFFWDSTLSVINNLLATMSPFLIGILIAFLINPLVSWMHHTVFEKWLYVKNNVLAHLLAITFSYVLVTHTLAQPSLSSTPSKPKAAALRSSVPTLPGSCTRSSAR